MEIVRTFRDKWKKKVNWPSLSFSCINPLRQASPEFRYLTDDPKAKLRQLLSCPPFIQISPGIKSQNPDRINSGPNTIQKKSKSVYFWTKTLQSSPITVPPMAGKDIKLLGLSFLFSDRQKSRLDPFLSACVPFSRLSGTCHIKTIAGTRWKTHEPTYANPSLSK